MKSTGDTRRTLLASVCLLVLALSLAGDGWNAAAFPSGLIQPRIFNGVRTFDYPFVGSLLKRDAPDQDWWSHCTVTLIGPSTALVAAHCVCPRTGSRCQPGSRYAPDPDAFRVFLQNAGFREIASFGIPSTSDFPDDDFAILRLSAPVEGIQPVTLAEELPAFGSAGEIVGFGAVTDVALANGVKRKGPVQTTSCDGELDDKLFVCWETPAGTDANTCQGDSGAPLLVQGLDGEKRLAGIASGGYGACDGEDLSFDTAVSAHITEILALSAGDSIGLKTGAAITAGATAEGVLSPLHGTESLSIRVPAGSSHLVVAANAADLAGNEATLRVRRDSPPTGIGDDCVSEQPGVFEACVLPDPDPGTWYASYELTAGAGGDAQISATAVEILCTLDLDGDGNFDALSDGLLFSRYLHGYREDALTQGALGVESTRTSPAEIGGHLDSAFCVRDLDVDGNGHRDSATDGKLVMRFLFGFTGDALVRGVIGKGATRTTADQIIQWLERLIR